MLAVCTPTLFKNAIITFFGLVEPSSLTKGVQYADFLGRLKKKLKASAYTGI